MIQPALPCLLIVDDAPQTGALNMQTDERLLEKVSASPLCSYTRIYRWCEPTVSLGYFQTGDATVDSRLSACPQVRRMTGGGAILHDREITYSCAVPACHPIRKSPTDLYELVHTAIIKLLKESGVVASMRMNAACDNRDQNDDRFLCFLRSDPRDIVCNGQKIVGSAQRRRRGNILQHGSVLLEASPVTPEVPGINDLSKHFDQAHFVQQLGQSLCSVITEW